jgi:hypothetical protein
VRAPSPALAPLIDAVSAVLGAGQSSPDPLLSLSAWLGETRFALVRSASSGSFLGDVDREWARRLMSACRLAQAHLDLPGPSTLPVVAQLYSTAQRAYLGQHAVGAATEEDWALVSYRTDQTVARAWFTPSSLSFAGHGVSSTAPPHLVTTRGLVRNFAARLADAAGTLAGDGGSSVLPVSLDAPTPALKSALGMEVSVAYKWRLGFGGGMRPSVPADTPLPPAPAATLDVLALWSDHLACSSPPDVHPALAGSLACARAARARSPLLAPGGVPDCPDTVTGAHLAAADLLSLRVHWAPTSLVRRTDALLRGGEGEGAAASANLCVADLLAGPDNAPNSTPSSTSTRRHAVPTLLSDAGPGWLLHSTLAATSPPCPAAARLVVLVEALRGARELHEDARDVERAELEDVLLAHSYAEGGQGAASASALASPSLALSASYVASPGPATAASAADAASRRQADEVVVEARVALVPEAAACTLGDAALATIYGDGSGGEEDGGEAAGARRRVAATPPPAPAPAHIPMWGGISGGADGLTRDESDESGRSEDDGEAGEGGGDDDLDDGGEDGDGEVDEGSEPVLVLPGDGPGAPVLPAESSVRTPPPMRRRDKLRGRLRSLRDTALGAPGAIGGIRAVRTAADGVQGAISGAVTSAKLVLGGARAVEGHVADVSRYLADGDIEEVLRIAETAALTGGGIASTSSASSSARLVGKSAPIGTILSAFAVAVADLCGRIVAGPIRGTASARTASSGGGEAAGGGGPQSSSSSRAPDFFGLGRMWPSLSAWAAAEGRNAEGAARHRILQEICTRVVCACWAAFVRGLRGSWEASLTHGAERGGAGANSAGGVVGQIDHDHCLLHQKLQLLQLCVSAIDSCAPAVGANEEGSGVVATVPAASPPSTPARAAVAAGAGHEGTFAASLGTGLDMSALDVSTGSTKGHEEGATARDSPSFPGVPRVLEARVELASGHALSPAGPAFVLAGPLIVVDGTGVGGPRADAASSPPLLRLQPLVVPRLQPPPPVTEDSAIAEARVLMRVGAGSFVCPHRHGGDRGEDAAAAASASLGRPHYLSLDVIAADAASFRAANPLAGLVDFLRWYFPDAWRPHAAPQDIAGVRTGDAAVDAAVASLAGELDAGLGSVALHWATSSDGLTLRLVQSGSGFGARSVWTAVWAASEKRRARPLFRPIEAAESVLHWLETVPASELIAHVMAASLVSLVDQLAEAVGRTAVALGDDTEGSAYPPSRIPWLSSGFDVVESDAAGLAGKVDTWSLSAVAAGGGGGRGNERGLRVHARDGAGENEAVETPSAASPPPFTPTRPTPARQARRAALLSAMRSHRQESGGPRTMTTPVAPSPSFSPGERVDLSSPPGAALRDLEMHAALAQARDAQAEVVALSGVSLAAALADVETLAERQLWLASVLAGGVGPSSFAASHSPLASAAARSARRKAALVAPLVLAATDPVAALTHGALTAATPREYDAGDGMGWPASAFLAAQVDGQPTYFRQAGADLGSPPAAAATLPPPASSSAGAAAAHAVPVPFLVGGGAEGSGAYKAGAEYSRLVPAAGLAGEEAATQVQRSALLFAVQALRGGLSPTGASTASESDLAVRADEASAVLTSGHRRSLVPSAAGKGWPFQPHRMFVRADFEGVRVALRVGEADG